MALGLCLRIQVPNASLFPEIDIASKGVAGKSSAPPVDVLGNPRSFSQLVYPLSNSRSGQIRRRLTSSRFFVRSSYMEEDRTIGHVVLTLRENGSPLDKNIPYR